MFAHCDRMTEDVVPKVLHMGDAEAQGRYDKERHLLQG